MLNERVKPELVRDINARQPDVFGFMKEGLAPDDLHDEAVRAFENLHSLPLGTHDGVERLERLYRKTFQDNPKFAALREAFDTWCAVWFWPADRLGREALTPENFYHVEEDTRISVGHISEDIKFFHWELEFPDVFLQGRSGFDAIVGNPPWEVSKPNSQEFFTSYLPIYRTYGKQEALNQQAALFSSSDDAEREWLLYNAHFKALSNWVSRSAQPFGDPEYDESEGISLIRSQPNASLSVHSHWRRRRTGRKCYADPEHPFRHQGSADLNTYKMFLEVCHALLRLNGRLGMIVPSGLYTDKGSTRLRILFLDKCRWERLVGFINWERIFNIYYRFKFAVLFVVKGGQTESIECAFGRYSIADLQQPDTYSISLSSKSVEKLSPRSRALVEPRTKKDLDILQRIYDRAVLLGDDSKTAWQVKYTTEFHMTNDSKLFSPRPMWEEQGYRSDAYGRWLKGGWRPMSGAPGDGIRCRVGGQWVDLRPGIVPSVDGNQFIAEDDIEATAVPLYEGRMIGQFDFSQKGWVSGKGRSAVWREIPNEQKCLEPQYLMAERKFLEADLDHGQKIGFLAVGSATNSRSMVSSVVGGFPCGNSVAVLHPRRSDASQLLFIAMLNSWVYDFSLRCRLGGVNLNYFILEETAVLPPTSSLCERLVNAAAEPLIRIHPSFATEVLGATSQHREVRNRSVITALTCHERLRLRALIDASIAYLWGLSMTDVAWILRNDPSDPKGFWRVDQYKPIELRHATLTLCAFRDLKEMGLESFCSISDPQGLLGCGWQMPETVTISEKGDGTIEFDAKDGKPLPVREQLGPRFLPWQLEQTPEESWAEYELHARNILGEEKFKRLLQELRGELPQPEPPEMSEPVTGPDGQAKLFTTGVPDLFGHDRAPVRRGRR